MTELDRLEALATRVCQLSPPERLRLAAGLLEQKQAAVALTIVERIAQELRLALILAGHP